MSDKEMPASLSEAIKEGSKDSEQLIGGFFQDKNATPQDPNFGGMAGTSAMPGMVDSFSEAYTLLKHIGKGTPKALKMVPADLVTKTSLKKLVDKLLYVDGGYSFLNVYYRTFIHAFGLKQWGDIPEKDLKKMMLTIEMQNQILWQGNLHTMMQIENAGAWVPIQYGLDIPQHSQVAFRTSPQWGHSLNELQFELNVTEFIGIH